jgi:hypothetical protein
MQTLSKVILSCAFVFSHAAWADGGTSCATAQTVFSGATFIGDTTTSTNWVLNFGGLPSTGLDLAFKYTPDGNETGPIVVTITGGWNAGAVITASCGGNAGVPISAGTGTATIAVPLQTADGHPLTTGQLYYFYITGNPADDSGPGGPFSFTMPFSPVTLPTFYVE